MGQTALIPAWVARSPREVTDCHWLAHSGAEQNGPQSRHADVLRVMSWVADTDPSEAEAVAAMRSFSAVPGAYDTLTWLLGMGSIPPIQLPRRNPDGAVVTADQLYAEYMTGKSGSPERKLEARRKANRAASLYRQLAALVPH